eukprot:CAMPEP_0179071236 /NCGR_PEP_ID=MMETSP0796-20121207/31429_1 /TAXON_ID=73915 /ORGANISM="Pyrodinium bahamense, Strain pbaha01" /LENGTH=76 /DNA_ID=CAMNT_0020768347 /DNA_START=162 /DNA_END=389 /DNA_ORIENTATION=+
MVHGSSSLDASAGPPVHANGHLAAASSSAAWGVRYATGPPSAPSPATAAAAAGPAPQEAGPGVQDGGPASGAGAAP